MKITLEDDNGVEHTFDVPNDARVSESPSVTGYVPSVDEIKAFTPVQAKGFIVGNITLKLYKMGMPAEQAGEMANLILYKAGA